MEDVPENGGKTDGLRPGDIVIVCRQLNDGYPEASGRIDAMTIEEIDRQYILCHAALVDIQDGKVLILDVTKDRGVSLRPLEVFLRDFTRTDGSHPAFVVLRSRQDGLGKSWIQNARPFLGWAYNNRIPALRQSVQASSGQ